MDKPSQEPKGERQHTTRTCRTSAEPSCCNSSNQPTVSWAEGTVDTDIGPIQRVKTRLSRADKWGAVKVRLGIHRFNYSIPPGVYAVGTPSKQSPVLVTANYKLTFDALRKELTGLDAWLLVVDTQGINVWCAAGGGLFSTDALIYELQKAQLSSLVSHNELIVPQLGAPGISAPTVRRQTGYKVIYGPVRAEDICNFLETGCQADAPMRRVRFDLRERAVVIPLELRTWAVYMIALAAVFATTGTFISNGFSGGILRGGAIYGLLAVVSGYIAGGVFTPLFLPLLPGRAFSVKGLLCGGAVACLLLAAASVHEGASAVNANLPAVMGWIFTSCAIASFMALNYTGTSTYTSLSGVKRETRLAIPFQCAGLAVGLGLWILAALM